MEELHALLVYTMYMYTQTAIIASYLFVTHTPRIENIKGNHNWTIYCITSKSCELTFLPFSLVTVLQDSVTDSEEIIYPIRAPSSCSAPPDLLLTTSQDRLTANDALMGNGGENNNLQQDHHNHHRKTMTTCHRCSPVAAHPAPATNNNTTSGSGGGDGGGGHHSRKMRAAYQLLQEKERSQKALATNASGPAKENLRPNSNEMSDSVRLEVRLMK